MQSHTAGSHAVFVQGLPFLASKKLVYVPGGQNLKEYKHLQVNGSTDNHGKLTNIIYNCDDK